ncbi:hypothetical protein Glove_177g142 [Diversispora epigaea]|uniref:BTB domain-containing protein n=1 Tax=Diversispora epigaea TaxID=1348612 RepID=A0A397INL3_9GLOM|nr:hypothetical protein Glove_177g142 [Diversispora epigaea]
MVLKFFDKLSQNLIELLNDRDDYNVIIEVENKELENIKPDENNNKIIIKLSISAQIFNVILQYIYGGIVDLENCETRFIYDLMLAADEFELEELETLLIETKGSWLRTHFSFIYHFIFNRHDDFKKLKNFCNDIVVKYPNLIFDADDFTSLEESALVSLLKRNDLQMEEENFLKLKTTLQQCLPHIRYFHLSSIEVVDKIEPYRKILDKQLWKDINQHLLIPKISFEKPRESFSIIITEEHAAKISTWIDHGFAPQTFWNMCHGYPGTDEIIRGYNPLSWDNSKWVETRDSFIFSLKNGNIQNSILSRVKGQYAVYNRSKNDQINGGSIFW